MVNGQDSSAAYMSEGLVISKLMGGLGNQLFQYAHGKSAALLRGSDFMVDIEDVGNTHNGYELERVFNLKLVTPTKKNYQEVLGFYGPGWMRKYLSKEKFRFFRPKNIVAECDANEGSKEERILKNCYFVGYWQSYNYFKNFSNAIREDLTFKNQLFGVNLKTSYMMKDSNSISLHIRRGDYANNLKTLKHHGLCTVDYYKSAMNLMRLQRKDPIFFVFSDDLNWAQDKLSCDSSVIFVEGNVGVDSHYDMQLMSLCGDHIIANSSFSWWGAWLNKNPYKFVIAPKKWYAKTDIDRNLLLDNWIAI